MTFEQHCAWPNFLLQSLQREAPPGYSKPSLHQLILCDKSAFSRLAMTLGAVRQKEDLTYPLGEELLTLRSDPTIVLDLAPLAKAPSSSSTTRPAPYTASVAARPYTKVEKAKGKVAKARHRPCLKNFETSGIALAVASPFALPTI